MVIFHCYVSSPEGSTGIVECSWCFDGDVLDFHRIHGDSIMIRRAEHGVESQEIKTCRKTWISNYKQQRMEENGGLI